MRWTVFFFGLLFVIAGYGWLFFDSKVEWAFLSDVGQQNLLDYQNRDTPVWWHAWRLGLLSELLLLNALVVSLVFFKKLERFKLGIGLVAALLLPLRLFDLAQQIVFKSNMLFAGYELLVIALLLLSVVWVAFYAPTPATLKRVPLAAYPHALVINDQNFLGAFIKKLLGKKDHVLGYDQLISELKVMEAEQLMLSGINKELSNEQAYYYLLDNCATAIESSLVAFSQTQNQKELDKAYKAIKLLKETREKLLPATNNIS